MMTTQEPGTTRAGFQLDDGAVVICRQLQDGWWEAWVVEPGASKENSDGTRVPAFCGPTRFKAQCKATRWYEESVKNTLNACA